MERFFLLLLFFLFFSFGTCLNPCLTALTSGFHAGMLDASGKTWNDVGKYQECTMLTKNHTFHTCVYEFLVEKQLNVKLGLCLPSLCTAREMIIFSAEILDIFHMNSSSAIQVVSAHCAKEENPKLDDGAIGAVFVCSLLALLVIVGTLLDYLSPSVPSPVSSLPTLHKKVEDESQKTTSTPAPAPVPTSTSLPILDEVKVEPSTSHGTTILNIQEENEATPLLDLRTPSPQLNPLQSFFVNRLTNRESNVFIFFQAFSLIYNWPRLFGTVPGNTNALNGLRTLSMLWIILGHSVSELKDVGFDNAIYVFTDYFKKFAFQFVGGGEFAVDSFFFIGGFLVAYMGLKEIIRSGKINLFAYYFHRFWRLSPVYFFVLLVWFKLSPYFVFGPLWYLHTPRVQQTCGPYWWTNILYINNFYPTNFADQPCMGWSWYLANDMQFFIFTPIMIYAYHKNKKVGLALISFLIIVCWVITGVLVGVNDLSYSYFSPHNNDFLNMVYTKPYTRMAPYLIGVGSGFLFFDLEVKYGDRKTKKLNFQIPPLVLWVGYFLSAAFLFLPTYGTYTLYNGSGWGSTEEIFFITFSRSGFTLGVAWLMFTCFVGYGGVLKKFFEADIWATGARLTYSAYLIHPFLLWVAYSNQTRVFHFDELTLTYHYITFCVGAYACGLVLFLVIERPMMNLEKIIFHH